VGYQPLYDDRPPRRTDPLVPAPWVETDTGDGCLVSTVGDMARYVRMLLNRGQGPRRPIISAESFDRMTQAHSVIEPGVSYGYGLEMPEVDGHAYLMHADARRRDAGIQLDVARRPGSGSGGRRAGERAVPPRHPRLCRPAAARRVGAARLARSRPARSRADERTLTVASEGDRLILDHGGERVVLAGRGEDSFYVPHPDFARFLLRFGRSEDRAVEAFHGPAWYVNDHYGGPRARELSAGHVSTGTAAVPAARHRG
jgi:hypothetical protein